ncbi:ArsR family transcriptional regulator [Candidatus Woesearchaeota archaeon]|nr:MAG: ArsR family transcriptional regulator [Candidatus Woesearchaeota archaeon]
MKAYLLKEEKNRLYYSPAVFLKSMKAISHPIKERILEMLNKKPMYSMEIAKKLGMQEQKVYYHINHLVDAGILEVVERKEIRGTTAKKYKPVAMNFCVSMSKEWHELHRLMEKKDKHLLEFLSPFIQNNELQAKIVVGSPDPHGPHKARARDGHYGIDLAVFLGQYCTIGKKFSVNVDVDVDLEKGENLIVVGGPVTNLIGAKINEYLPAKYTDKKPWGIQGKMKVYTDDNIGIISRITHPHNPNAKILYIAGIRFSGTKAAVIALTRFWPQVLQRFTGQKSFYSIVEGFDMDGDGRIDSVEVLE